MNIDEIEKYLEEFTGNLYKKFAKDSTEQYTEIFKDFLKIRSIDKTYNPYSLYTMKVLDIIDKEFLKYNYFDQEEGFITVKTYHKDGNDFMSNNEIYAVVNELENTPKNSKVVKQICSRVRVLCFLSTWNNSIDCEYDLFEGVSSKYLEESKIYFKCNKKYMRYARLLKCALGEAKYYEVPDYLPINETEYRTFLNSPFVYVMLEPHNFIQKSIFEDIEIVRGIIIEGSILTF